jgi:hypothetical protein
MEICYNQSDDYQWFVDGPIGKDPVIENNTILRVLPANTDFNWCISLHETIPGASIRNNIFVLANRVKAFEWENPGNTTSDNIYFSVDGSRNNPKGYSLKSGEIIADPLFVDYDARDLHLRSGSPAVDMGEASRYAFDLDGNPVPQGHAVDAGAYESSFSVSARAHFYPGKVAIYPNPSTGMIHFTNLEYPGYPDQSITIHDLTGRVVKTQDVEDQGTTVDLADQDKGVYIVKVGSTATKIHIR